MITQTSPILVTAAPAPVPVENLTPAPARFTILLATDGSAAAETAFEEAVTLARYSKGRLVLTFYAYPEDSGLFGGQACCCNEQWQASGRQVLERLAEKARAAGVPQVETVLEHYQDEESLYQLGGEIGANMTTLASHCFRFN